MKLLKLFAVFSFMLVGFPIVFTLDCADFGDFSVLRILLYFVLGVGVIVIGNVSASGFNSCRGKKVIYALAKAGIGIIAALIITLVIVAAVAFHLKQAISFALLLFYMLCYFIGCSSFGKNFSDVFPLGWLGGYVIETIIMYFTLGAMVPAEMIKTGQSVILAMFIAECAFAAVLINQTNILTQANRRSETRGMLPKNMRAYNLLLISGISSLLLLTYVLRDFIASVLFNIFKAIVNFTLFLIELLPSDTVDITDDYEMGEGAMPTAEPMENNSMIIIIALFLLVLFLARRPIIKGIKTAIKNIISFFSEKKNSETVYNEAYFDEYEEINRVRERRQKPLTLRECLRDYSRERDGRVKFRLGYKAYLMWLREYKIQVLPSDTAARHEKKGETLSNDEQLCKKIENYYNRLRYDGEFSDEADKAMSELIAVISK